jgi:proline racemase
VKVGIDTGYFPVAGPQTVLRIDTPAGRVTATAHIRDGRAERVTFRNVPSFVLAADQTVDVPDVGSVRYDLASGGAFYAYTDADVLGLALTPDNQRQIIDVGMRIKRAVMASYDIVHPDGQPDMNFLYGTIFVSMTQGGTNHSRNVCVFAEGEVDRSPTGTGVSGRLAIHHMRGEISPGQVITIESILGTCFTGQVVEQTRVGNIDAIIPEVGGIAHITGRHEFLIDPDDPLSGGFMLR